MQRGASGIEVNLPPFIVGFYENQVFRIDETFAQLFEDYYHEVYKLNYSRSNPNSTG
jgi:hypothetical protein